MTGEENWATVCAFCSEVSKSRNSFDDDVETERMTFNGDPGVERYAEACTFWSSLAFCIVFRVVNVVSKDTELSIEVISGNRQVTTSPFCDDVKTSDSQSEREDAGEVRRMKQSGVIVAGPSMVKKKTVPSLPAVTSCLPSSLIAIAVTAALCGLETYNSWNRGVFGAGGAVVIGCLSKRIAPFSKPAKKVLPLPSIACVGL